MAPRDRRQIRYEQFVKPQRRRWPWFALSAALFALAAAAAYAFLNHPSDPTHTPPALSSAGGPVANETYQWRHVAIGAGGFITGLSVDASGKTLVVRTDVYGAYIWDAGANRWMQLVTAASMPAIDRVQDGMAEGAYEIAVAPSRADRIYLAIKGYVYRSDNRGQAWQLAGAGNPFPVVWNANAAYRLGGPYLAVDPANPDLVLLGTPAAGLWRSTDAGGHWQKIDSVPASTAPAGGPVAGGIKIWFEQPAGGQPTGRIFALSPGHGMSVSSDHGAHFAPLANRGDQPMNLRHGVFDRQGRFFGVDDAAQSVWSYHDGGWHDLGHESGLPARIYGAIAANPRTDQVVLFDQGGAGYASTDGGQSWRSISHSSSVGAGDPPWLRVSDAAYFATADIRFDPKVPNRLWVAAGMGVFHADLGPDVSVAAWQSQSRGIEELVANDVVQAPGHAPIFGGLDFGMHVKSDLNAWSTTFGPNERSLISVQQLDWTPADPDFIVTNASDVRIGCCAEDGNAVMAGFSRDDGQHWTKFHTLPTPPGTRDDDPWRMSFGSIAVSSGNPDNIVWEPAYNRQPYYTTDRGKSWHPVNLDGATGDNPGSFAQIWYQRKTITADKTTGGTFYFMHSGEPPNEALTGLWRSTDLGASWQRVFPGQIAPNSGFAAKLRSVPGHAGHLFFTSGVADTSDTGLRRSSDGGATWTMVPRVTRVDDIAFGKAAPRADYPAIYISGKVGGLYGIWRSLDNAASWQRLVDFPVGTLDQVTAVGADPDVFGRVYLGYKGSGWIWGEPAPCQEAPLRGLSSDQCSRIEQ